MGKRKRFYSLSYQSNSEPVFIEDAGSRLKISGILVQGMGSSFLLVSPAGDNTENLEIVYPELDEWCEFLRRTDDPLAFETDETGTIKAIHRKQERSISGVVQQKIWVRDGCQCLLCGRMMGDVQLTVDHWVPLEKGGDETVSNLISCCRKCNKRKGSIPPKEYCTDNDLDFMGIDLYLQGKGPKSFIAHLQN